MSSGSVTSQASVAVRAAGSAMWNVAQQAVQTVLGFATAAALTIWLRPDDYGVFSMAATIVAFIGIFGDAGLTQTLVRRPELDEVVEASGFVMAMLAGLLLTAAALLAAPVLGLYFGRRDVGVMAAVLAANFLITAPGRVSSAKLMRQLRYRALSAIGLTSSVIASALGIMAASRGMGGWSLALSFLAAPAILSVLYWATDPPAVGRARFSRPVARELSAFGAKLSGFTLAVSIAALPTTVLVGRFAGPAALGLFSMGMRLIAIPTSKIGGAFSAVFLPAIGKVAPDERRRSYLLTLRTLTMFTAPVALGILAVADELVTVLPPSWSGLAPTLKIFAVGAVIESLGPMPTALLTAEGRSDTVFRLGLFVIPWAWLVFGVGAWMGTLSAFAVAWSVMNIVGGIVFLSVAAGNRKEAIRVLASLIRPIVAAVLMCLGVTLLLRVTGTSGRRSGLLVGIPAGVLLHYGLCSVLLPAETRRAVKLIRSALGRGNAP